MCTVSNINTHFTHSHTHTLPPTHSHTQVTSLQEEIRQLKERNQQLGLEVRKRDNAIASLKTDIEGLRREIQERDDTIQDKVGSHTHTHHIGYIQNTVKTSQTSSHRYK